jgi:DNA gyrase/topoisomerase IV subunit A
LTKAGTLKRVNPANYRPVKKPVGDTDIELCNITALASQRIVLISNNGTMYKLPVAKIPVCNTGAAGMPTKDLFK